LSLKIVDPTAKDLGKSVQAHQSVHLWGGASHFGQKAARAPRGAPKNIKQGPIETALVAEGAGEETPLSACHKKADAVTGRVKRQG